MKAKRMIFASVAAISIIVLSACNTFEGMGRDISQAGDAIGTTATRTKDRINGH